jgi:hypothetical protein
MKRVDVVVEAVDGVDFERSPKEAHRFICLGIRTG